MMCTYQTIPRHCNTHGGTSHTGLQYLAGNDDGHNWYLDFNPEKVICFEVRVTFSEII